MWVDGGSLLGLCKTRTALYDSMGVSVGGRKEFEGLVGYITTVIVYHRYIISKNTISTLV